MTKKAVTMTIMIKLLRLSETKGEPASYSPPQTSLMFLSSFQADVSFGIEQKRRSM